MENHRRFIHLVKVIDNKYFKDLGDIELIDEDNINILKIKVVPHEGIHKDIEYILTIKFQENSWPLVYIDSEIFDKIKTKQYLENRGKNGNHKGICIKNFSYGYPFDKNFKNICDNKWENYIYQLISLFNNLEDFEKGNGFTSKYKQILNIV